MGCSGCGVSSWTCSPRAAPTSIRARCGGRWRRKEAGQDAKLSFEVQPNGRLKLNVDRLGALGEAVSLRWLRKTTAAMLPKIDLPDLLFEVDSWTGFLDAFVHLGDGRTRMENLKTSLVALLVAEVILSRPKGVLDVEQAQMRPRALPGGCGYLPQSITQIPWRSDARTACGDARLAA